MTPSPVVALAGGVGASRFLRGLVRVIPPGDLRVVINTGDDREFYGVHVSPDVDIVTYTLAGMVDDERGYGLRGDTTRIVDTLGALGEEAWFRLGDQDLAHCLYRTLALRRGMGLAEITDRLRRHHGVDATLFPMSEDPCPTMILLRDGTRVHFEDYLARDGAPDEVAGVDLGAAQRASAAPGVLEAIRGAQVILVCPSNPIVSIGPIVAIPGVHDAIRASGAPVVGVSPIVGGAPIKGPADRLLRGLGMEVSALGVATLYRDWIDGFVIDDRDATLAPDIEALGLRVDVTETLMRTPEIAAALAQRALGLATATP